jgi:hypothetical protein
MLSQNSGDEKIAPVGAIAEAILVLRGQKVILDADLARLYGVSTTRLNEQVRRNADRFPSDFMFKLTAEEFRNLMSHFATSSWGGRRKPPHAFTEHGALMAATVLNTPRAVEVGVYVVRAFIRLRELLASHAELSHKLLELEGRLDGHDKQIGALIQAIRELLTQPEKPERQIGFRVRERSKRTYTRNGQS